MPTQEVTELELVVLAPVTMDGDDDAVGDDDEKLDEDEADEEDADAEPVV